MRRDKRPITLLEIMLVVALISLTFGLIATRVPEALRVERFERGVDQVQTKITLAQELMLDYQTDVLLELEPVEEGLLCRIKAGVPLTAELEKKINRYPLIKGIEAARFENREARLFFDGTVGSTPKGYLYLTGRNREAILTLKGFPSQTLRGEYAEQNSHALYPEAIISFI